MKRSLIFLNLIFFVGLGKLYAQDTLELATAVQIGLDNNFNIKIAEGQQKILENDNTLGNAGFLPTLDLSAAQRYTLENTTQQFISGDQQNRDGAKSNNFSAGGAFNWVLFDGSTMFHTKNKLEELEKMGMAYSESVVQNIVALIAKEFYTVALEQIRLGLLEENIGLSEDRMEIAKNKYEYGKSSKMEYLQAQVDLNRDKSNYMIQQENLSAAKTALNELMGREVTRDFYAVFDPELNTGLQYEELRSAMEANNPELMASQFEMNASRLVQKELFGERIPEIGVNVGYNYAKSEAQAGFLLSRQSSGITYGVSAVWNIFDGFNLNRRIQNAKVLSENLELNYEATRLSLERELYSIFINYQNNIQLRTMEEVNREVAREGNEIAIERYRVGNSSPLELREAQIALLEANLRFMNAAYSIKTGEIDLLMLAGLLMR
ncbi:MAG: TolC family protein [Cyclobacteriaceae bacterium]|nr:TolC family protein [Cyclobacteriaceae bacterium]